MQLTSRTWIPAVLAMGAIAFHPSASMAQAQGKPAQAPSRWTPEQKLEHIKIMRGKMLREQVGLDENKAVEVEKALAAFDADHVKFHQAKRDARVQLREVVKDPNANDKAYRAAVAKQRAAHKQMYNLREREWNRVSTMLTPKQQALLLLSLGKMKHHYGKKCGYDGTDGPKADCQCPHCGGPGMCAAGGKGPGSPSVKPAPGKPNVKPVVPPQRRAPGAQVSPGAGVGPVTGPGPAPSK